MRILLAISLFPVLAAAQGLGTKGDNEIQLNVTRAATPKDASEAKDIMGRGLDGNGNGVAEGSPADDFKSEFTVARDRVNSPVILGYGPKGYNVNSTTSIVSNIRRRAR